MRIVTQDRKKDINYDNMMIETAYGNKSATIYAHMPDMVITMGEYDTTKRAKNVMEQIRHDYEQTEGCAYVFEMPEK